MGCISSKKDFDDIHPNIFQVMNVDELGSPLSPGQLEITDVDLIFFQQGKTPVKWPLRTLRRYGFESDVFSFESGRRCPTGPGIYAFQCRRAEQLFNLMQNRIQLRSTAENESLGVPLFPMSNNQGRSDGNYLEPAPLRRCNPSRFSFQNVNGVMTRLSSLGSASGSMGPLSPQSGSIPPLPVDIAPVPPVRPTSQNLYANEEVIAASLIHSNSVEETNNNKSSPTPVTPTQPLQHIYTNQIPETSSPEHKSETDKVELISESASPVEENHLYMNITPGIVDSLKPSSLNKQLSGEWESDDPHHCYANLDPEEIENISRLPRLPSMPLTPTDNPTRSINYIVLDLEPSDAPKSPTNSLPPESPRTTEGYATIDFNKTVALSHSVNPTFDNDDSSRKTRHNSTINDLLLQKRHSSSLSD